MRARQWKQGQMLAEKPAVMMRIVRQDFGIENCKLHQIAAVEYRHPKRKCIASLKAIPICSCMMRTSRTSLHEPQQHSPLSGLAIQCLVCLLPGQERRLHQRYGAWFASHASHSSVPEYHSALTGPDSNFHQCHVAMVRLLINGDHSHPI